MAHQVIAVVGLGYVGLPLAVEFDKAGLKVIGYDKRSRKIEQLQNRVDITGEVEPRDLRETNVEFTDDPSRIREADVVIVVVPTPVNEVNVPDLSILHEATRTVGENMKKGAIVTFESTVYPGATEEECVPILEAASQLKFGRDFTIGYSPERVNPGDKDHTIPKIVKVVAGSDEKTLQRLTRLYRRIIKAGVHQAPNIKTAEIAKVIENCQRDLNIALMNELALICERLGIKTMDVIEAATTKWNIYRYTPGLVGGHCIGVDPYYLVHKAKKLGVATDVITAGRRINDSMPQRVGELMVRSLVKAEKQVRGARILVLGLTFKENVRDTRNAGIARTIEYLQRFGVEILACDPLINDEGLEYHPPLTYYRELSKNLRVDGLILAAGHDEFKSITPRRLRRLFGQRPAVVVDVRNFFDPSIVGKDGVYASL